MFLCIRLAITAFRNVLSRRQSKYGDVITWLDLKLEIMQARKGKEFRRLMEITMPDPMTSRMLQHKGRFKLDSQSHGQV